MSPLAHSNFENFGAQNSSTWPLGPMDPCKLDGYAWVMGDGWGLEPWPLAAAQECHRCWRRPSASFASSKSSFGATKTILLLCFALSAFTSIDCAFEHRFIAFFRSHFGPV